VKKETTKKGNKVTTIYDIKKVDDISLKEIIADIKKEYPSKTITLTVQQ
jgi:hypothetical protein